MKLRYLGVFSKVSEVFQKKNILGRLAEISASRDLSILVMFFEIWEENLKNLHISEFEVTNFKKHFVFRRAYLGTKTPVSIISILDRGVSSKEQTLASCPMRGTFFWRALGYTYPPSGDSPDPSVCLTGGDSTPVLGGGAFLYLYW